MPKVVPNCCIFYILLCGHIFENVPFYQGMQITSFTFQKSMNMCMWYIYAHSTRILFVFPCHSPFFHTKSKFENGDFVGFWTSILWHLGVHPMIMIIQNVPYKKGTMSEPTNMDKPCTIPTCLQTLVFHNQYTT
jgi:hypothetical protein